MFYIGVENILSNIRLYYWIIRGRFFVKSISKNCYLCKLVLGKPAMPPPTPSLPGYRLHCMFPFQTAGIDYSGPVYVRDVYSRCDELFKCNFLNLHPIFCPTSMFSRRGTPSQIISDNFKTF